MREGLTLRGLGDRARRSTAAETCPDARKKTNFLDEWSTDPETDVAPGVTQGRNMRSRC